MDIGHGIIDVWIMDKRQGIMDKRCEKTQNEWIMDNGRRMYG